MSYVFGSVEQKQEASRLIAARNNTGNNAACKRMIEKVCGSPNAILSTLVEADNLILSLRTQLEQAQPTLAQTLHDELTPRGFK
jgi:hypothetical protein